MPPVHSVRLMHIKDASNVAAAAALAILRMQPAT
jgi:hypothetical protein